jgi:hypothetical protein
MKKLEIAEKLDMQNSKGNLTAEDEKLTLLSPVSKNIKFSLREQKQQSVMKDTLSHLGTGMTIEVKDEGSTQPSFRMG